MCIKLYCDKQVSSIDYAKKYSDYFTWSFTRDPLTRFVSSFCEIKYERKHLCFWESVETDKFSPSVLLDLLESRGEFEPHVMRQRTFLDHFEHRKKIDYIGNIEHMEECSNKIKELTGVVLGKSSSYKRETSSGRKPILTDDEIARLTLFYAVDFE